MDPKKEETMEDYSNEMEDYDKFGEEYDENATKEYDEEEEEEEEEEETTTETEKPMDIKPEQLLFHRSKGKNTDRDMWDDTALINAWDSAVKEYQNFHSLKNKPKPLKEDTAAAAATAATSTGATSSSFQRPPNKTTSGQSSSENLTTKEDAITAETDNVRKPTFKKAEKSPLKNPTQGLGPSKKSKPLSSNKTSQPSETTATPTTSYPDAYAYYPQSSNYYPSDATGFEGYTDQQYQYYQHAPYGGESSMSHEASYMDAGNKPWGAGAAYPSTSYMQQQQQQQPHSAWNSWQGTPKAAAPPPPPPPPPAGLLPDDETLANLLMAWYFSGYYTGLYQAQRRR